MSGRERFLAACRREPVDRPPVWLMRQAGRYLPEYQELRAQHDFLEMCRSPALAAEVTLQPIRRYHMDAAVVFSDILVLPEAMGQTVAYPKGGPTLEPTVRTAGDLRRLRPVEPSVALDYVAEALRRLRRELAEDHALLGFAGAPYTLATYMVEGATSRHQPETKRLAFTEPELLDELLALLADQIAAFLRLQVEAGVDAVQIFDTWAGDLMPADFHRLARRPTQRVVEALADLEVPIIYYVNGIASHLEAAEATGASALSIDWRLDLAEARRRTGGRVALQGNLDPLYLQAPREAIARRVREIHASMDGAPGHIFNLGHGVLPFIPTEGVAAFVEAVQELGDA
jgi:uroporphyrinogen decarboxylase